MHNIFRLKVGVIIMCTWGLLFTACEPIPASGSSNLVSCKPTSDVNVYRFPNEASVELIYQNALVLGQAIYNEFHLNARHQALMLLRDEVRRWSSFNDIPVSETQIARITVTHVSPELVQVVILNQYLSNPMALSLEEFRQKLYDEMIQIAQRDELFFLVTLSTSEYNQDAAGNNMLVLDIPVKEMILVNADDLRIPPSHDDHPLDQEIILSREHLSGYVSYPIAVQMDETCEEVMAPLWNTTMTISLSRLWVNGSQYEHQLTWFIKYHPLVDLEIDAGMVVPPLPADLDQSRLLPVQVPPKLVTNIPTPEDVYWNDYWEATARYIWGYITDP